MTAPSTVDNRYYSSTLARFTTPDPYRASGGPADPQSWNRYAYVQNDPVNANDPSGLLGCNVETDPAGCFWAWFTPLDSRQFPHLIGEPGPTGPPRPGVSPDNSYRMDAFTAIHGLSKNCRDKLNDVGIDIDALAATAMTINFWDATNPRVGNRTQNSIFNNGVFWTLAESGGSNNVAYVVLDRDGNSTRNVVLNANFFGPTLNPTSTANRNAALTHETLHIHMSLNDRQLYNAFGITRADDEMGFSESISAWLRQDCPDVVITPPL